jgi:hypothetical protein
MRMFEVEPGGFTPYHQHPYEHEVYILEGTGVFVTEEEELPFEPGHVLYADPDMMHQFRTPAARLCAFCASFPTRPRLSRRKRPSTPSPPVRQTPAEAMMDDTTISLRELYNGMDTDSRAEDLRFFRNLVTAPGPAALRWPPSACS